MMLYLVSNTKRGYYICATNSKEAKDIALFVFKLKQTKAFSCEPVYSVRSLAKETWSNSYTVQALVSELPTGYFDDTQIVKYTGISWYKFVPFNVRTGYIDELLKFI